MSAEGATGAAPGGVPLNATASMEVFMKGLETSLGKSLAPLEKISKQMGGSKFGKNVKQLGSAMKGMAGASVQAWAMEQLMKLIEPFMKLLQLLEIPINILSALLSVMVNEIFVQLLPFFLQFSQILIDLMPIFKVLGEIIGKALVWALTNIIKYLTIVWTFWKEIAQFLAKVFLPIWEKIKAFLEPFVTFLKGIFLPLWDLIKKAFMVLKKAWEDSGGKIFGKDGFIAKGFQALLKFGKDLVNWFIGAINNVIRLINRIPGVDIGTIPKLQEGGITTGETLALLHPKEAVIPLERAGEFGFGKDPELLEAIEEGNRQRAIMIKRQRETDAWQL